MFRFGGRGSASSGGRSISAARTAPADRPKAMATRRRQHRHTGLIVQPLSPFAAACPERPDTTHHAPPQSSVNARIGRRRRSRRPLTPPSPRGGTARATHVTAARGGLAQGDRIIRSESLGGRASLAHAQLRTPHPPVAGLCPNPSKLWRRHRPPLPSPGEPALRQKTGSKDRCCSAFCIRLGPVVWGPGRACLPARGCCTLMLSEEHRVKGIAACLTC